MVNEQKVLTKKEKETDDEEERKHFCKVISAFRFYRLAEHQLNDFSRFCDFIGSGRGSMFCNSPRMGHLRAKQEI